MTKFKMAIAALAMALPFGAMTVGSAEAAHRGYGGNHGGYSNSHGGGNGYQRHYRRYSYAPRHSEFRRHYRPWRFGFSRHGGGYGGRSH